MIRGMAFVDICGTLIDANTLSEFVRFAHATKITKCSRRNRFFISLLGKRLRVIDSKAFRLKAVQSLAGITHKELILIANQFYQERCQTKINNELVTHLHSLKYAGFQVVLVTATLCVIAEAIAKNLGFHSVLATNLQFHNSVATGSIEGEFCEKHEKVDRILTKFPYVTRLAIPTAAYGNTLDDLVMLEWAKFPHVIWGTMELKKIAKKNQWPLGVHPSIDSYDITKLVEL